jgi:uncharacterized protein (TIGR02117 family)
LKILGLLAALALAGCSTLHERKVTAVPEADSGPRIVIYVIRRRWHTDIGFNAADVPLPLAAIRSTLPAAQYLLFGFGDRHYLMNKGRSTAGLLGAVWPGPGVVLVTGLTATPEKAFGNEGVIRLTLSADQARRLEDFVWKTLATTDSVPTGLEAGPYDGSYYYAATVGYSGLNTCNTWTAEALKVAGLPVNSFGVELSGQVWHQVRKIELEQGAAARSLP